MYNSSFWDTIAGTQTANAIQMLARRQEEARQYTMKFHVSDKTAVDEIDSRIQKGERFVSSITIGSTLLVIMERYQP